MTALYFQKKDQNYNELTPNNGRRGEVGDLGDYYEIFIYMLFIEVIIYYLKLYCITKDKNRGYCSGEIF